MKNTKKIAPTPQPPLALLLSSYQRFLQAEKEPEDRYEGLHEVFLSIFPVVSADGSRSLEFVSYALEAPKCNEAECLQLGISYASPLKVTMRLLIFDTKETPKIIENIMEQEVYFGELPLLTKRGTFIIHGAERFCSTSVRLRAEQLYFFLGDEGPESWLVGRGGLAKIVLAKSGAFRCSIEPAIGVPFRYICKDHALREPRTLFLKEKGYGLSFDLKSRGKIVSDDITDSLGEVLLKKGQKLTATLLLALQERGIFSAPIAARELKYFYAADDVYSADQQSLLLEKGRAISPSLGLLAQHGVTECPVYSVKELTKELSTQGFRSEDEALSWLREVLRPGFLSAIEASAAVAERPLDSIGKTLRQIAEKKASADQLSTPWRWSYHGPGEQLADLCWRAISEVAQHSQLLLDNFHAGDWFMPHDLLDAKPLSRQLTKFFETQPFLEGACPVASLQARRLIKNAAMLPAYGHREGEPSLYTTLERESLGFPNHPVLLIAQALTPGHPRETHRWELAQSITTPESPMLLSGLETLIGLDTGVTTATSAGVVSFISEGAVFVSSVAPHATLCVYEKDPPRALPDGTLLMQRPAVAVGDSVAAGAAIFDSYATHKGKLALGRNLRVAFDDVDGAIVSQRAARLFQQVQAVELICPVFDRKQEHEALTSTPLGFDESHIKHLDVDGVIKEGALVSAGEVLVGKSLLEIAGPSRDNSLVAPSGGPWSVLLVQRSCRPGQERSEAHNAQVEARRQALRRKRDKKIEIMRALVRAECSPMMLGKKTMSKLVDERGALLVAKGQELTIALLQGLPDKYLPELELEDNHTRHLFEKLEEGLYSIEVEHQEAEARLSRSEELEPGVHHQIKLILTRPLPLEPEHILSSRYSDHWRVTSLREDALMPSGADIILPRTLSAEARRELEETSGFLYLMRAGQPAPQK